MMAIYRSCVVCVLLCVLYSVHSFSIRGTITKNIFELPTEVQVLASVNGDDFGKVFDLTLNRLVYGDTLPTLILANFQSLHTLNIINISLEHVPMFENISTDYIGITGNKLKYVPTDAFNGARVRRLDLDNNEIQSMSDRSINQGVTDLYLRCNKLGNFSSAWFKDPSSLGGLDLDNNRIEYIQHDAFDQMTSLAVLKLSYNHITRIGSEAFSSDITHLHLQFNNITQLTPDMFAQREKPVHFLYLHHNQLSFLSEALLVTLKLKHISLDGNPWQCQCLRDIERWVRELNIKRHYLRSRSDEPVCVVPLSFQYLCISVADKELQQTYARGLSPVQGCLATPCTPCPYLGLDIEFH